MPDTIQTETVTLAEANDIPVPKLTPPPPRLLPLLPSTLNPSKS